MIQQVARSHAVLLHFHLRLSAQELGQKCLADGDCLLIRNTHLPTEIDFQVVIPEPIVENKRSTIT